MTLIPLNTTYEVLVGKTIGNSGYKVVYYYSYSGTNSNHSVYKVVKAESIPIDITNQYTTYRGYPYEDILIDIDWRDTIWYTSTHEWTIAGKDGCTYRFWQVPMGNFYYEVTALSAPIWTCNVPFDGYETDQNGNLRINTDGTCTPAIWKCNEPKDGFETDQYGNTKKNTNCKEVIIPDIIQDIIPEEITKYLPYIILIIGIIVIYFLIRK